MGKGLLDLEKHFAFYGAYQSNRINIAIHMVFVWPIFFTALLMLYFTPSLFNLPHLEVFLFGTHFVLVLNFGFLLALIYSVFYVCLDVKAGSLAALLCAICWVASSFIASRLGFSLAWKVVLVAQILCWTVQFIGHGIFEGRAPALLDNLVQAFIMAPFFVLLEYLGIQRGFEVTCMSTSWLWKEASLRMAESFRLYSLNTVVLKSLKFLEANSKLAVFLCFLQSSPSALKIPSPSSTSIYE